MKLIKQILIVLSLFSITACASKNIQITVDSYEYFEAQLNNRINVVNKEMIDAIKRQKNSINFDEFDIETNIIKIELDSIIYTAKLMTDSINSKVLKKYHDYNIKILQIQAEYAIETINQYRNGGEFGGYSAKKTQIVYNQKLREIKKEKEKLYKFLEKEKKEMGYLR